MQPRRSKCARRCGALVGALIVLVALPVRAQDNPSADQIIQSLQPGDGLPGTTRGIRPAAPVPAEQAVVALPQAQAGGQARSQAPEGGVAPAPSVNLTVQFTIGSPGLTPAARRTLDELGRAVSSPALAAYQFRIEGHTDTVGSSAANLTLSAQRAEAVVAYLAEHFNVDRHRLQPVGLGEQEPLVRTGAQVPEPRNRRVLVVNLGS